MSGLGEVKAALNVSLADDAHWILELTKARKSHLKIGGLKYD